MFSLKRAVTALSLSAALAGCGGPAMIPLPDICQSFSDVLPGTPGGLVATYKQTFSGPIDTSVLQGKKIHGHVKTVTFVAKSGATSFDFMDAFTASMLPPADATFGPAEVVHYERQGQSTGGTLVMTGEPADIVPYLAAGKSSVEVTFTGRLPTEDSTFDVTLCAALELEVAL